MHFIHFKLNQLAKPNYLVWTELNEYKCMSTASKISQTQKVKNFFLWQMRTVAGPHGPCIVLNGMMEPLELQAGVSAIRTATYCNCMTSLSALICFSEMSIFLLVPRVTQ